MKAPKNILDIIISNKTSLGDNPALPPELNEKFLVFLVNKHYNDLASRFKYIDIDGMSDELNHSLTECQKIERANKEALEMLCSDVINELFGIPNDTLIFDMKIVGEVDTKQERMVPENMEDYSFDSIEDMNNITSEIYKRRFLNSLIIGAAMYYTECVDLYSEKISKIDDRLPLLYKKIMYLNDFLLFHTKNDLTKKQVDGGKVDVYLSEPTTPVRIESQGLIFPILLQETIKGLLELSISHGLPNNAEKAKYITSKTDFKLAEVWDQRLGLPLWGRIVELMDKIGEDPLNVGLNFVFMEIAKLRPSTFNSAMQEILAHTKAGASIIGKISEDILYQKEKDEFDDYMTQKCVDNKFPLNDDDSEEFTSDELINDDLCSTTILDEMDY